MPQPTPGEKVLAVARVAAQAARMLYPGPVKVAVLVYSPDDPEILSHADTDMDRERLLAAMRRALALLEAAQGPLGAEPPGGERAAAGPAGGKAGKRIH